MGKRAVSATRELIEATPLPQHASTYTVIPHKFVIEETLAALAQAGLGVETELYRSSSNGDVAQGIYQLALATDPEMSMLFTWANSYDKTMRFKCAIGGYISASGNRLIAGASGSFGRKHTGNADQETQKAIVDRITSAGTYYNELIEDKKILKQIQITPQQRAEFLGRLFFEKHILNAEQMVIIKHQFKRPEFEYHSELDSLWVLYNNIAYALQKSHPRKWMDHQTIMHWMLFDHFKVDEAFTKKLVDEVMPIQVSPPAQEEVLEPVPTQEIDDVSQISGEKLLRRLCELNKSKFVAADKMIYLNPGQEADEEMQNLARELGYTINPSLFEEEIDTKNQ